MDLYKSFNNPKFSDVKILIQGETLFSHKVVVFQSKVLKGLCVQNVIEIKDIKKEIFQEILVYLYTGILMMNEDNISELSNAADKLKMDAIKNYCSQHFLSKYNEDNVCSLLKNGMANKYPFIDQKLLIDKCKEFISKNIKNVFKSDDIVNIDEETLVSMLKDEKIEAEEHVLLEGLYRWAKYKSNTEGKPITDYTKNLVSFIKLSQIEPQILVKVIKPWNIIPDKEYKKAIEYHLAPEYISESEIQSDPFYQPRKSGQTFVFDLKTNPKAINFKLTKNNTCVERTMGSGWNDCQVYSSKKITTKTYMEFTIHNINGDKSGFVIGLVEDNNYNIQFSQGIGIGMSGNKYKTTGGVPSGNVGDKIGMLVDIPAKKVKFYKDGSSLNIEGVLSKNSYYACVHLYYSQDSCSLSFPMKIPK